MRLKHASVQASRLGISAIQSNVIELSGGEYRAVLEVNGVARAFENDARSEALQAGFATFLNGLSYPIQILVRASPVDLSRYVATLKDHGQRHSGQLADLARDHATFVQGLAKQRTLLERRFFVVVPSEPGSRSRWRWHLGRSSQNLHEDSRRDAAHQQLAFRCEDVARQLARCGLGARRLGDLELAQLYLACWSPERARAQRFRQQLDEYTTLAVRTTRVLDRAVSEC